MHGGKGRIFLAVGLVAAVLVGGAVLRNKPWVDEPESPIGGYHYNGTTSQGQRMTFSTYGRSIPLFEGKVECAGGIVGTSGIEAIAIRKGDSRYWFDLRVKAMVGYSDEKPADNGDVEISGTFARDAKTAKGHLSVRSARCDNVRVKWTATAQPDVVR